MLTRSTESTQGTSRDDDRTPDVGYPADTQDGDGRDPTELVSLEDDPCEDDQWVSDQPTGRKPRGGGLAPAREGSAHNAAGREALQLLQEAWQRLQRLGQQDAVDPRDEQEFLEEVVRLLPDPEDFQPGRIRLHVAVWRAFFQAANEGRPLTDKQKQWLEYLRGGIQLEWVACDYPGQELAPERGRKLAIVREMLRVAAPDCDLDFMMAGDRPRAVQFPNHRSATQHHEFVTAELRKALDRGVIREWPADAPSPTVVNGLRVVEKDGKLRLCINPMYINCFLRYRPVKYERLAEVPSYLLPEDWLYTTDDKSGYWQLSLHEREHTYLAMRWRGQTLFWPHLPFGLAPACHLYTSMKLEVFRPLRQLGVRMSFLIDDQMGAAGSKAAAQFQCGAVVRLLAALGFTLSLSKCQLIPRRRVRFLGMEVDAEAQAFRVPDDKLARFRALLTQLEGERLTARQVAQVAGKIIAMTPAVTTAPLYARMVWRVARDVAWDEEVWDSAEVLRQAGLFMELLGRRNGTATWRKGPALRLTTELVGDASDRAFAAFLPGEELGANSRMLVPFKAQETQRLQRNDFSSTERELRALLYSLHWLREQAPNLLYGRTVQYQTDSQPAEFCMVGMKGNAACLPIVAEIHRLCADTDTDISVVWYPRSREQQQQADALSKYEDGSQWMLNPTVYAKLWEHPCVHGRSPSLDVFADAHTTKVPGSFFAANWCPGVKGVDAFAQDWGSPGWGRRDGGETVRPLLYINPPFSAVARVLRKVAEERPDCVLILPVWPRAWVAILRTLPIRAQMTLAHRELFIPGPQVPNAAKRGPMTPRYRVQAVYVLW
uniref:Reverse transcriptase n=1 Tax=Volvox carteri f. nagariensis TaxID=3068 RepID=Q8L753_VOLCA|nr:reverse transcriptase [Volvox carteri f. nagariensis]